MQKSFINGSLDEQNTFTLDFGMEEADSLRLYVKPRTGGTVPPSLFNVEIKVCYIPGKYLNNRYIFMSPGEHLMLTLGNPLILSVFTTYFFVIYHKLLVFCKMPPEEHLMFTLGDPLTLSLFTTYFMLCTVT